MKLCNSLVEVARLTRLAGVENVVDVQNDTSYSARPQAGTEKGQQSFSATIEHITIKEDFNYSLANKKVTKHFQPMQTLHHPSAA
jgi:hypothetical protein